MLALRVIGRSFIGLGVIILLFLGYQMFGTNFITGREQKALASDLASKWEVDTPAHVKPDLGGGVALIKIPKIGVDRVVVEGVEVEHLKKGPGHYPETAMPGQRGNMVVSGHRTTYGAPFYRLDELRVGDEIVVVDGVGSYQYRVTESKIVRPTDLGVIAPSSDARLTLTTCHPRSSARQRLIIVAALQGAPRQAAA
jgi:sortase A